MTAPSARLAEAVDALVGRPGSEGRTLALVVLHRGEVAAEWYGTTPDTAFGPGGPVGSDTPLISWSTAKSMVHAAVGIAVAEGVVHLEAPAPVPVWSGTDKAAIRWIDLLEMRPGLRFVEDYVDGDTSHCIDMLFGSGAADHAAYAAALPLDHRPGTVWNYSSGTTNIICRLLGDAIGGGADTMRAWLADRLFGPAGMESASPRFDDAGTWVGSSYVDACARDFARFGELYRTDGIGPTGVRVIPERWADHARVVVAHDPADGVAGGFDYGRHWWMWPMFPGSLAAHGYEGQYVLVVPDRELVVAHLGVTAADVRHRLVARLAEVVRSVEPRDGP